MKDGNADPGRVGWANKTNRTTEDGTISIKMAEGVVGGSLAYVPPSKKKSRPRESLSTLTCKGS